MTSTGIDAAVPAARWRSSRARCLAAAVVLLAAPPVFAAVDRAAVERQFQAWLVADIWPAAKTAKVSRATFDAAMAGVTLDWTLRDLQPPGEPVKPPKVEWQAEFSSPGAYFAEDRLALLARSGGALLAKWKKTLAKVEARSGVPAGILVAIWGRESGYGAAALPRAAIRTLATSAFMGRRADFYRTELIAALRILQRGDIALNAMRSSVAGALGQPQFMPSVFLSDAVDFDGDGRKDIWSSPPDVLASIAQFLDDKGWVRGRSWGVEAHVPGSVACSLEGPEQGKTVAEWTKLGVKQVDGSPLPATSSTAYLLMPAGRFGPAFIVTDNFYVLKSYNNSDLYALYIGQLADRLSGGGAFTANWNTVGGFTRGEVKHMQDELVAEGYDVGNPDGLIGFKTRIAVGLWQAKQGTKVTCLPDRKMITSIH